MGIVVCISMLLGLTVLQPTPWNRSARVKQPTQFVMFTAFSLLSLGLWNVIYGYFTISGFWMWASLISGSAMVLASFYVFIEQGSESSDIDHSNVRKATTIVLALSFLVYAVTLIQLNLGYPILGQS